MSDDRIILDWRNVYESGPWADRWDYSIALYGIIHFSDDEILCLGKAHGETSTVRRRWNADDKHERGWSRIEKERGIYNHRFFVGEFRMPEGERLTREPVGDIESLLIKQLRPWANRQNTKSRGYTRPGMVICCQGHWPFRPRVFHDA